MNKRNEGSDLTVFTLGQSLVLANRWTVARGDKEQKRRSR